MKSTIISDKIFLEDKIISGTIEVSNSLIYKISEDLIKKPTYCLKSLNIFAGFIDIHVHGKNSYDTMDNTYTSLNNLSIDKAKEGVTSFCPTTVTSTIKNTKRAIKNVKVAMEKGVMGSKIIGSFLEGPFISKNQKGAHNEKYVLEIDKQLLDDFIEIGDGSICSVAIAPEKKNAQEIIKYLTEKNINTRIGHTDANFSVAEQAIKNGANISIHTFNAMSQFNHREPNALGAVLTNYLIYNELICDLIHVSKAAIEILIRCKKNKIILITDCIRAGGLTDGEYNLGDLSVIVKKGVARLFDNTLAGSTLTMLEAVKNMKKITNIELLSIINMATINPAKALKLDKEIGSLSINKKADIIACDDDFNLKFVMIDGKVILAP